MNRSRSYFSILLVITMIMSLLVSFHTALAVGTVTVTYDTGIPYSRGDVVSLTANVSGFESILNVEFYDGTTLLGNVKTSPYTFNYINLPSGNRSITAKVTDGSQSITTSEAITLSVGEAPSTGKTFIVGNDFTAYTGGFGTFNNITFSNYTTTATSVQAPGRTTGDKCVKFAVPATAGEAYRIYLKNIYTKMNTENVKVEISMDMNFADFNNVRSFLKMQGATDATGATALGNTFVPLSFRTDGTITYTNSTSHTLMDNGNTGSNAYQLQTDTWYTFKYVTWINGTNRMWEFYINDVKALETQVNSSNLYYMRNNYVYCTTSGVATNPSTTFVDNVSAYESPLTTMAASISTPISGTTVEAGTAVDLTASASISDASAHIQKVQYYQNGQLLGESVTSPYTVNVTLSVGSYSIIARAVSNTGLNTYSTPISLNVFQPGNRQMLSTIMNSKNGADSIVTMTFDDGLVNTAEYLDQMFEIYHLKGTCMIIANALGNELTRFQNVIANGFVDIASHSTTHANLDNDAISEDTYKYEIDDSKTSLKTMFPNQDIIAFAPSNNNMTTAGLVHVKNTFFAQRKGSRGYNSLNPTADEWYNIKTQGIGDVSTVDDRNAWVDNAIANGQWLLEMWHGIAEGTYQTQTKANAEQHFAYISQKQNEGKVWCASFTEATKYIRERQVSTVEATLNNDSVDVNLTYPVNSLPSEVFDYPLTVKVEVPEGWGMVNVNQGGQECIVSSFIDNGVNSAYVNLVPNAGTAILTSAGTSNKLTDIKLNGTSLTGFVTNTFSYDVVVEEELLPVHITAIPLDNTASVTYSPSATLDSLPRSVIISVKDANNVEQNYTINFTRATSTNNKLTSISLNGENISIFSEDVTSYNVMAPSGATDVTVAAVPANGMASISYSPSATVNVFPTTVTITVTAESGAAKIYTVIVNSRSVDLEYLYDDFEGYTLSKMLDTTKWSSHNNIYQSGSYVSGVVSALDPLDNANKVGKCFNIQGTNQNQQLNKYITKTTEPVVVKGRYMLNELNTGSHFAVLVRGEGTNMVNICNFAANGEIKIDNSSAAVAQYVACQWVDYVLVISPVVGKYSVTGYFTGEGIRDTSGNVTSSVIATKETASNSNANMATIDCRILARGDVASGANNAAYIDEIRIYSPGDFKLTMQETIDIDVSKGITVQANHDVATNTITNNSVIVKNAQGANVNVASVDAKGDSFTVHFTDAVPTGDYTLSLADAATDVIGQKSSNTISFSVLGSTEPEIPAAPVVTKDDIANTIIGLDLLTMEYAISIDEGASYGAYTSDDLPLLIGSKMVKVRVKATGQNPVGLDSILSFTPNAGDVNGDGFINISDVIMAAEIAVGCSGYTTEQIVRANVSSKTNVVVDIADVVMILERAVDGTITFPVELPI